MPRPAPGVRVSRWHWRTTGTRQHTVAAQVRSRTAPPEQTRRLAALAGAMTALSQGTELLKVDLYAVVVGLLFIDYKDFLRTNLIDSHQLVTLVSRWVEIRLTLCFVLESAGEQYRSTIGNFISRCKLAGSRTQLHPIALAGRAG